MPNYTISVPSEYGTATRDAYVARASEEEQAAATTVSKQNALVVKMLKRQMKDVVMAYQRTRNTTVTQAVTDADTALVTAQAAAMTATATRKAAEAAEDAAVEQSFA
jgi:hypothetical protein